MMRKRSSKRGKNESIPRSIASLATERFPVGAPDAMCVKLKYTDGYSFAGTPIPAAQVWRANSVFDPDFTGAGHQPTYFDQWAALYESYTVLECDVDLNVVNNGSIGLFCSLVGNDIDNSSETVTLTSEKKETKPFMVGGTSGTSMTHIRRKFDMAKLNGVPREMLMSDPDYTTSVAGNPVDATWIWFKAMSADTSTNVSFQVYATLTYSVVFQGVKATSSS